MIKYSIAVPCYNECDNLVIFAERALHSLECRTDVEIILVNNGSSDNSKEVIANIVAKNSLFRFFDVPINIGYGHGIISGLSVARGKVFGWTHADLQADPNDIKTAIELYEISNLNDIMVRGKRVSRNPIDYCITIAMQVVTLFFLFVWLDEINAQPKLFSKSFYVEYIKDNAPYDFSLDLFIRYIAKLHNLKQITFPVKFLTRLNGKANGGGSDLITKLNVIGKTISYILQLKGSRKRE
jgi:glycosyltransferase involved in cell wall biosynthesis